jgi:radical SAM protein with 4Fe4S-binding SPASM domain
LSTAEGFRLIGAIAGFAKPVLILTGGEPMSRPDIYDLARCATDCGLRAVMAPCGHLLDPVSVRRLMDAGVRRISVSLDGADASTHDTFRGVPGAFESALRGLRHAREACLEFQINTTVSLHNVRQLPTILDLAVRLGASAFDIFFLVPTGRGAVLGNLVIPPEEYERTLRWIATTADAAPLPIKTTCAPHYTRVTAGRTRAVGKGVCRPPASGCMAGRGFVFISHRGVLQPCGFLDAPCGDLRHVEFDFRRLYETSPVFLSLADVDSYRGKCGVCGYRQVCGGCRARAYAASGDYLAEEPACAYIPLDERAAV